MAFFCPTFWQWGHSTRSLLPFAIEDIPISVNSFCFLELAIEAAFQTLCPCILIFFFLHSNEYSVGFNPETPSPPFVLFLSIPVPMSFLPYFFIYFFSSSNALSSDKFSARNIILSLFFGTATLCFLNALLPLPFPM